jgi:hypothetical protein
MNDKLYHIQNDKLSHIQNKITNALCPTISCSSLLSNFLISHAAIISLVDPDMADVIKCSRYGD